MKVKGLDSCESSHRGLDRLLAAAEQQRLRQMKRIYLMQRHAEKQAALARAHHEKEAKDRLREQAMEAAAQRANAERQLQEALAEVNSVALYKRELLGVAAVRIPTLLFVCCASCLDPLTKLVLHGPSSRLLIVSEYVVQRLTLVLPVAKLDHFMTFVCACSNGERMQQPRQRIRQSSSGCACCRRSALQRLTASWWVSLSHFQTCL